MYATYTLDCF